MEGEPVEGSLGNGVQWQMVNRACRSYLSHHQRAVLGVVAVSVIGMGVLLVAHTTKGVIRTLAS